MLVVVMMKMVVMVKMTSPFRLPHGVMLSVEKGVEVRLEIARRTSTFVMIGIVLCEKKCERKRQRQRTINKKRHRRFGIVFDLVGGKLLKLLDFFFNY